MTQPLSELQEDEILRLIEAAEATVAAAEGNLKKLRAHLLDLKQADIDAALAAKPEPFGDVKITVGNRQVKVTAPKKVKWSQDLLRAKHKEIAESGENPEQYLKVEYSVSETAYKAWPSDIKDYFADARTVERGSVSIKIVEEKE